MSHLVHRLHALVLTSCLGLSSPGYSQEPESLQAEREEWAKEPERIQAAREEWAKTGQLSSGMDYHLAGISYEKEKDYKTANQLFEKAIKSGYLGSEHSLGLNQVNGRGIQKNLEEGAARILRARRGGFIDGIPEKKHSARVEIDVGFFRQVHALPGYAETIRVGVEAKTLAEAGASELMNEAARARLKGLWLEAVHMYLMAGDKGDVDAWNKLGLMCDGGKELPKNDKLAMSFFFKGAALGSRPCYNGLGYYYLNGLGREKCGVLGRYYFEKAAILGDARGASNAGELWSHGVGGPQDHKKAFSYFQKAYELNNARGTFYLGECYEHGKGVAKDLVKAFEYYLKAATMGDDFGCFSVAYAYHMGRGVKRDVLKAEPFYRHAAAQGDRVACHNLATMLIDKQSGLKTDARLSRALYEKAARLGHKPAQEFLRRIGPDKTKAKAPSAPPYKDKQVTEILTAARQDLDKEKLLECITKCQEAISRLNQGDPADWLAWTLAHATLAAAYNGVTLSNGRIELPTTGTGNSLSLALEAISAGLMFGKSDEKRLKARFPDRCGKIYEEQMIAYAIIASRSKDKGLVSSAAAALGTAMQDWAKTVESYSFMASGFRTMAWVILESGFSFPTTEQDGGISAGIEQAESALFYGSLDEVVTPSQRILIARSKVLLACGLTKRLAESASGDAIAWEGTRIEELLKQAGSTFRELCPGTTDAASVSDQEDTLKLAILVGTKKQLRKAIYGDAPTTPEQEKELNALILEDGSSPKQEAAGTKPGTEPPAPRESK